MGCLASAQLEAGEWSEVLATLKQTLRAARQIKEDPDFPLPPTIRMGTDKASQRIATLRCIAVLQAKAGDRDASGATFEQVSQGIGETIKGSGARASALVELARARTEAGDAEGTRAAWDKALDFAQSLSDPSQKAKAVETIVRARIAAGELDEAIKTIDERLSRDLKAYATWAAADAVMDDERPVEASKTTRLRELADGAEFERNSRRAKAMVRIAEAQVKAGDFDGALGTVEAINDPNAPRYRYEQAKVSVLRAISRARLNAGNKDAAQAAMKEALEIASPFYDDDGLYYLSWEEIAAEQARLGGVEAASQTADAIGSSVSRAKAFSAIATALAEAGDRDNARKSIERALKAAEGIPADMLWTAGRSDMDLKPLAMHVIAVAQWKTGDAEAAMKTIDGISSENPFPARIERFEALEEIANEQIAKGDLDGALKTANAIPADDPFMETKKSPVIEKIVRRRVETGDSRGALDLALKLDNPAAKVSALRAVAEGIAASRTPAKGSPPAIDAASKPGQAGKDPEK